MSTDSTGSGSGTGERSSELDLAPEVETLVGEEVDALYSAAHEAWRINGGNSAEPFFIVTLNGQCLSIQRAEHFMDVPSNTGLAGRIVRGVQRARGRFNPDTDGPNRVLYMIMFNSAVSTDTTKTIYLNAPWRSLAASATAEQDVYITDPLGEVAVINEPLSLQSTYGAVVEATACIQVGEAMSREVGDLVDELTDVSEEMGEKIGQLWLDTIEKVIRMTLNTTPLKLSGVHTFKVSRMFGIPEDQRISEVEIRVEDPANRRIEAAIYFENNDGLYVWIIGRYSSRGELISCIMEYNYPGFNEDSDPVPAYLKFVKREDVKEAMRTQVIPFSLTPKAAS